MPVTWAGGEDTKMANRSEAYDYSYFEDISSNTVIDDYAYQQPQIEQEPRENVVELPQRRERPESKPKHWRRRLEMAKYLAVILLVGGISAAAVYSEVQLTEITEEINEVKNQLEEAESLEVQLTMQAAQRMSDAQVEAYAVDQLGMGKLSGSQVVYLHVAQQDRGTVVQEAGESSWLDKVFATVRGWFA